MNSSTGVFVLSIIFLRFTSSLALSSPYRSAFSVDRRSRDAPVNIVKDGSQSSKPGMHKVKYHSPKLLPQTSPPTVYQSFSFSSPSGTGPGASQDYVDNSIYQIHQMTPGHLYSQPTTVSSYQVPDYHHNHEVSHLSSGYPMKGYNTRGGFASNTYGPPAYGPPPSVMTSSQYGPPPTMYGYGGGHMEKDTGSPVNFSAVGLLGLLAVMGMIQHVMTELDNMKPTTPPEDSETGNSMSGGKPPPSTGVRPTTKPRPTTTTAKPKRIFYQLLKKSSGDEPRKRVKRNDIANSNSSSESPILQLPVIVRTHRLPQNVLDNFIKLILPSYFEVAYILGGNGNEKDYSVTQNNLQKAKSQAEKIVKLLVDEFHVPQNIAIFCVNHSMEVMRTQTDRVFRSLGVFGAT